MILFLLTAGTLWGIGHLMRTPRRHRWAMILLLFLVVLVLQFVLPEENTLRQSLGEKWEWVITGVLGLAIWGYTAVLKMLKARVRPENRAEESKTDTASPTERYARHIIMREIGGPGQKRLSNARVLVVGAGGLGSPVIQYLAAAGVGTLGVIDDDVVDVTNLQRQTIHSESRRDMPKVFSAQKFVADLNPLVAVKPYHRRLTAEIAPDLFADYDLIIEGSDDIDTKYLVNRVARQLGKPLIFGALSQWEGQLSLFDPATDSPCYRCIFPEPAAPGLAPSCAEGGVLGPLPGVIGTMMAVEAVKFITGAGDTLTGRMMIYDALYAETRVISLSRRADCPDCAETALEGAHASP